MDYNKNTPHFFKNGHDLFEDSRKCKFVILSLVATNRNRAQTLSELMLTPPLVPTLMSSLSLHQFMYSADLHLQNSKLK